MADHTVEVILRLIQQGNFAGAIAELNKLQGAAAANTEEQAAMAAGAKELNTELHAAGKAAEVKTAALQRLTLAGAAAGAAIVLAKEAVEAFAEKQHAIVSLDAALANQGQLVDSVREKYQGLADDLERLTNIDDSNWVNALATLSKFDADPARIEEYANAVKNLAGFMGGDLQSAAFLFGKALQGHYEMLGRYGIEVSEAGTKTEKLNELMEQLAQRGGGQLEARAKSLTGGFAGVKIAVGNLLEGLGNLISSTHVTEVALYILSGTINGLASIFPSLTEKVGDLGNKFKELATDAGGAQTAVKDAVEATTVALDKQGKEILRVRQLQDSMGDAQTAAKLADVDAREARGELQPHQVTAERARIKRDAESAKLGTEHIAAQKSLDAAKAARVAASGDSKTALGAAENAGGALDDAAAKAGMDPDNLKNLFGRATLDAAAAKKKIQSAGRGLLGGPDSPPLDEEAVATGQRELADANQRLETIKKLAELKGEAAAKEQAYQSTLQKEKGIFDSTAESIQSATDALTVLEEKYKALTATAGADKAKESRALFDKLAETFRQMFGVDLKMGPIPTPAPGALPRNPSSSRGQRLNEAEDRLRNTNRSFDRNDPEADAAARMTGGFAATDSEVQFDQQAVGAAVGNQVAQVVDITQQLVAAINGSTTDIERKIQTMRRDIENLTSRVNTRRS